MKQFMRPFVLAAALLLACWLAYAHVVLRPEFVSDDFRFIRQNIYIQNLRHLPSYFVSTASWDWSQDMYRPLRSVSFALEYALWGLDPRPFHAASVLLHGMNGLLVFAFARMLCGGIGAAMVSALFVLHPCQMEAIGWVACRADPMFALFGLLSILFYVRGRRAASACAFGLALLSKEMAASLPLVLMLVDFARRPKRRISVPLGHFGVLAAYLALRFIVLRQWGQTEEMDAAAWVGEAWPRILASATAFARALEVLHFPNNLCAGRAFDIRLGALAACAGSFWLAFMLVGGRAARAGGAWVVLSWLPLSGVLPLKTVYQDRYLYFVCIGAFLSLAAVCVRVRRKAHALGLALLAVVFLGALTIDRGFVWMGARPLSFDTVRKSPYDPINHFTLANALRAEGKLRRAVRAYERVLAAKPDDRRALHNLALTYLAAGRRAQGIRLLQRVMSLYPGYELAGYNLANAHANEGEFSRAAEVLERTLQSAPQSYRLWLLLGHLREKMGQTREALHAYRRAEAINPGSREAEAACVRLEGQ